jgi:hypothetical protein
MLRAKFAYDVRHVGSYKGEARTCRGRSAQNMLYFWTPLYVILLNPSVCLKGNILWCAILPREVRGPFAYDLRMIARQVLLLHKCLANAARISRTKFAQEVRHIARKSYTNGACTMYTFGPSVTCKSLTYNKTIFIRHKLTNICRAAVFMKVLSWLLPLLVSKLAAAENIHIKFSLSDPFPYFQRRGHAIAVA